MCQYVSLDNHDLNILNLSRDGQSVANDPRTPEAQWVPVRAGPMGVSGVSPGTLEQGCVIVQLWPWKKNV